MRPLDRRVARLETPPSADPVMEDWLDVLDAEDPGRALTALRRRFPNPSPDYGAALDALS